MSQSVSKTAGEAGNVAGAGPASASSLLPEVGASTVIVPAVGLRTLESLAFEPVLGDLPREFHTRLAPTPLSGVHLASFNPEAARLIDLDPAQAARPEFVAYLNGDRPWPGTDPLAMVYAGHQFGHFVPQLGDGRAISLGQVRNARGELWDLQMKGAGRTPYSRFADGRAVLRSTVREYLCSEAMHALGVPTTRALAMIGSSERVVRETVETGALVLRMAPSHIRFGSFEYFFHRGQHELVRVLADHVIDYHHPEFSGSGGAGPRYAEWFGEIVERTARMIAHWQSVGFAHGVMNTDNMSIHGITIDYGPFGFLDAFDAGHICNHSDEGGRYAFDNQPGIGYWNLACLAQALTPLIEVDTLKAMLARYEAAYGEQFLALMRAKLGLFEAHDDDLDLLTTLFEQLQAGRADYTIFFRRLGDLDEVRDPAATLADAAPVRDLFLDRARFDLWLARYRARRAIESGDAGERRARMRQANPKFVLRNYLAQAAIAAAQQGDYSDVDRLLWVLQRPFDEHPEHERYAALPPDWASGIEVSCSS